jgi:hypothetical protein
MAALTSTDLQGSLSLIAQGKVRDIYALPDNSSLLFVATDRISAYDVVMKNVPPPLPPLISSLALTYKTGDQRQRKTSHRALKLLVRVPGR